MSIDLWAIHLNRPLAEGEIEQLFVKLPAERRERLARIQNRARWREPLCAYGILQLALLQTYGLQELPKLIFGNYGKPAFLEIPEIHFSISHTNGAALVGLSDAPLGVDIEKLRPVSQRVQARLTAEGVLQKDYFRNWVRYEAAVKRRGEGVSLHHQEDVIHESWEVSLFPGYCAAVSGKKPIKAIHYCTIEDLM